MLNRRVVAGAIAIGSAIVVVLALLVGLDTSDERSRTAVPPSTATTAAVLVSPTTVVAPPTPAPSATGSASSTAAIAPPSGSVVINPPPSSVSPLPARTTTAAGAAASTLPVENGSTSTTREAPAEAAAPVPGVTKDRIRIAVAVDGNGAPGMRVWASDVNLRGGVAGRRVVLDVLRVGGDRDRYRAAIAAACERDFAVVGSTSAADDGGATASACGIPDLPVAAAPSTVGVTTFPVFPRDSGTELVGGVAWLVDHVSGCCRGVAVVRAGIAARVDATARVNAARAVGFRPVGTSGVLDSAAASAVLSAVETDGVTLIWTMLDGSATVGLRQQVPAVPGGAPVTWLCGAGCYGGAFLRAGGPSVEGQFVQIETNPFEDAEAVPGIRDYLRASSQVGMAPSTTGVEQDAAGLLLETAAAAAPAHLSRRQVLDALTNLHDFDADGIVGVTDIGARRATGCSVLLQVRDGQYDRVEPPDPGKLSCGPWNLRSSGGKE